MSKLFGICTLGILSIMQSIVLITGWILVSIHIIFTEIIGTKKFAKKFKALNNAITEEFFDIIKMFKELFNGSNF